MREYPDVSVKVLWELLEERLYNESQRRAQKTAFLQLQWNDKKDKLNYFADVFHSQGLSLGVNKDMIRTRFIKGLPVSLQTFAYGISGSYEEVVSAVSNISGTLSRTGRHNEVVREVIEDAPVQGSTVSKQAPAALTTEAVSEWKKNRRCYACEEVGHIARDPQCQGKRKDDAVHSGASADQGKASGSSQKNWIVGCLPKREVA